MVVLCLEDYLSLVNYVKFQRMEGLEWLLSLQRGSDRTTDFFFKSRQNKFFSKINILTENNVLQPF